jgi:hypothetical protein
MCQCLIQTVILGIPCIVAIDEIDYMSPDPDNDSSDLDYYGWLYYNWEIRNRKNQHIEWLEVKLARPENQVARNKLQNEMDSAVASYLSSRDLDSLI